MQRQRWQQREAWWQQRRQLGLQVSWVVEAVGVRFMRVIGTCWAPGSTAAGNPVVACVWGVASLQIKLVAETKQDLAQCGLLTHSSHAHMHSDNHVVCGWVCLVLCR